MQIIKLTKEQQEVAKGFSNKSRSIQYEIEELTTAAKEYNDSLWNFIYSEFPEAKQEKVVYNKETCELYVYSSKKDELIHKLEILKLACVEAQEFEIGVKIRDIIRDYSDIKDGKK